MRDALETMKNYELLSDRTVQILSTRILSKCRAKVGVVVRIKDGIANERDKIIYRHLVSEWIRHKQD